MFNRQALGAFIIALALPAYADTPPELEPKPLANPVISIRIHANTDVVYKTIGKLAGVTVVIDPDFKPQKIMVELTDVTLREAMDLVGLHTKAVWRAVTPNIISVYPKGAR